MGTVHHPEGGYGAGEVKVWDKGFYILEVREPRKYHVLLKGRKLKGDYRLINFKDNGKLSKKPRIYQLSGFGVRLLRAIHMVAFKR